MRTTIDPAGRVVIPKEIRRSLELKGTEEVEVVEEEGSIRISLPTRHVDLVEGPDGILIADPGAGLPGCDVDEVRTLLERVRR
ncbi:MAG: AbrB/MazE/SpoVT family DNA-binding domain-containing protein [Thermoleophilaceae bacterium]|nr:AbrB/MazE/SpoVT family DNA-binding domain-containing protein [Thermoleophilaceae bacterium]